MKVLSLFSGVGGFDLGLERAGMETVFQCEWDKHATKILEKHWPHVPRWDDVSTLTGKFILLHAPVIDVVAWGSPCQDLSVAGKRAGLEGARSGLFHEGVRIIKELRELTNGKYPRISIWENVAGALSSGKGADFGQVLTEMDEAGSCFSEWRILDAQYFGVPQRRRRVFLISVFDPATAARCPDPLLPVSESVRRDTETGTTTREEPASETTASFGNGSQWPAGENEHGVLRQSISSKWSKGSSGPSGDEFINMVVDEPPILIDRGAFNQGKNAQYKPIISESPVVPSLVARGPHAVFTKGKRAQTVDDDETWDENRPAPTLNQFDQGDTRATTIIVGEPVMLNYQGSKGNAITTEDGVSFTLNAMHGHDVHVVTQPVEEPVLLTMREGKPGGGKGPLLSTDKSLSLRTGNEQTLFQPAEDPILFENSYRDAARIATEGVTNTLSAKMGTGGNNTPMVAIGIQGTVIGRQDHNGPSGKGHTDEGDPMFTLTSTDRHGVVQYDGYNQRLYEDDVSVTLRIGRDSSDFIAQPASSTMAVRRLTPLECERLMGWPDDWTAGQSDTHRYKQCGNGVASPVATWIAQQLMKLDQ
jgi:DNA (cytosine-5)-methyltransferase 1